ncbi:DUF1592 domain-containing protein [Novosphingobium sp. JCM 18896]|uniref:DUF1592 domain-containing protein n=1 Tax=Novosphingobium sp. JCM 18896 TaxID=2989731 RepID=UPI002223240B|nr:DUF1592 domain-containing protein [Novosphingobium sp. JCM 18896]MCW1427799.1 DUF1592 domain-containing protein [Novosphingobium sp. JCM 18896]
MIARTFKPSTLRRIGLGLCLALAGGIGWAQQGAQPEPAAVVEPKPLGGPLLMRRLTESQYRATIADVFAPDVAIAGRFERGLREDGLIAVGTSHGSMSAFSLEQYDVSARGIAAEVTGEKRRAQFVPCQPKSESTFDKACATRFVTDYGLKLFRRPLSPQERDRFVQVAQAAQAKLGTFHQGLEYALIGMLDSPHFLLRMERAEPDPQQPGTMRLDGWSKAVRLSYFLTNTTPDAELLRAAAHGELHSEQGLARQVDRLLASPRLASSVRAFFWDMFQFDGFNDLFKDPAIYPAYTTAVARDAQEQTLRTVVSLLVTQQGDYRDLFTTRETWLSRPLGILYRVPVATRNGWERGEYPANSARAGILTDVSMLALHSHPGRSSPTLRGKSLREIFLCEKVPDPPANVNFSIVQDAVNRPGSTARLRLAEHNDNPVCAGCHKLTDPIGLTLENFDGAGSFRAKENGAELDLSGSLDGKDFSGATGLGQAMHDNPSVTGCLTEKLYRSAIGRDIAGNEEPFVEYLMGRFEAESFRVPALMRAIALSKTFYAVSPALDQGPQRTAAAAAKKGNRS